MSTIWCSPSTRMLWPPAIPRGAGELSFQGIPEGWVAEEVPESRLAKSFMTEWPTEDGDRDGYAGMSAKIFFVLRSSDGKEYEYLLEWGSGTPTPVTDDSLNSDPRVKAPSMPMDETGLGGGTEDVPSIEENSPTSPVPHLPIPPAIAIKASAVFQECDDDAIVNNMTGYYERHQFSYAPKPLIVLNKGCGDVTIHMYAVDKGSFGEVIKGEYDGGLLETVTVDEDDRLALYVRPK